MSTPKREGSYKRVADRAAEGDLDGLVEPLDYLLLEALPDEGTNVGGLYQVGSTVGQLAADFSKKSGAELTTVLITSRLTSLKARRLTRNVRLVADRGNTTRSNTAWQKTVFGKEVAERWRTAQTSQEKK